MSPPTALIYETIVTTVAPDGTPHIAPMGVRYEEDGALVVLMPFKPSTTLQNITSSGVAVVNLTTDVRIFTGCVTGQSNWPTVPATQLAGVRLAASLAHAELQLVEIHDDPQRPVLRLRRVYHAVHGPFHGFNRAQAAVIEGAVLVSRLHMLPAEKIDGEMTYLRIAINKTAGPDEREAWAMLEAAIAAHRASAAA